MKTIAFVIPYFGRLSDYFQLWLNSCKDNPTVDWLLFTDDERTFDYPPNVHVTYTRIEKIKSRLDSCFGSTVNLDYPYKLCDFKPFYGTLFHEELKGYDFWGYCDIDVIWGNFRKFVTDDLLEKYDRLFEYGHCCLMRNVKRVNESYQMQCKGVVDYHKVLSYPINFYYDEQEQMGKIFDKYFSDTYFKGIFCFDVDTMYKNFYPSSNMHHQRKSPCVFKKTSKGLWALWYEGDKILEEEFFYAHFQKRKMTVQLPMSSENFLIVPNKFLPYVSVTTENYKKLLARNILYWYPIKSTLLYIIDSIFDCSSRKMYFRGRFKRFFDKLFLRNKKQWYKDLYSE